MNASLPRLYDPPKTHNDVVSIKPHCATAKNLLEQEQVIRVVFLTLNLIPFSVFRKRLAFSRKSKREDTFFPFHFAIPI